ncbi:Co-chaperone protein HscB [Neolewinella maritima]|uniref:Co-chaperone protein HscB n=1 Tax=Neolewinella maritima TaxID=1383882 RepID=A0ABN8FD57_9BACT|nr:iron-sulfur cluster co-chaperone HscB C-terminal domain-containing protein [Neolewinella maritima]CAH1002091.1 Co-chaperone protein HscB [Neolewinella maritima]
MTDYFSFFGLRPSPTLDEAALRKTFYANSKRFHPDFHTLEDEETQQRVLEQSTLNNQGYKVLSDKDLRLKHLLQVKGVLGAEGTNEVPQDFLLEIMEVNEALMELEFEDDPLVRIQVTGLIDRLEAELHAEVADVWDSYDDSSITPAQLEQLKAYYLKRRYLLRLREKI